MSVSVQPSISVIVPVHLAGRSFDACLQALAHTDPPPAEIIIVSDGAAGDLERSAGGIGARVLRTGRRSGPATARNLGARQARGDIIFFVDADVAVPPDALRRVAEAFLRFPDLTALMGSYDDAPGDPGFLSQYRNLLHHWVHQTSSGEASTFWGACGAIRRDTFLGAGGFRESYRRPSIEDIELGYRLKKSGCRILLLKSLQVKHLKRWRVATLLKADFFHRALPWTELILRDRAFINDLNLTTESRISVALALTLLLTGVAAPWKPFLALPAAAAALALLLINQRLYRFFREKRGTLFALRAIPWHWLYFLYSGLAFGVGVALHALRKPAPAPAGTENAPARLEPEYPPRSG